MIRRYSKAIATAFLLTQVNLAQADNIDLQDFVPESISRQTSYLRDVELTDSLAEELIEKGIDPSQHCFQVFKHFQGATPPTFNYSWAYSLEISTDAPCPSGPARPSTLVQSFYIGANSSLIDGFGWHGIGALDSTLASQYAKLNKLCMGSKCYFAIRNEKICEIVPQHGSPTKPACRG